MTKPLTIGIDASRATRTNRTGTENYSWEIIQRILPKNHDVNFRLYTPFLPKDDFALPENSQWRVLQPDRLWSQVQLARELRRHRPDVVFIPAHVLPLLTNVPAVVTVHDIAFHYFPKVYRAFDRRYLNFSTALAVARAKAIIVPSVATKNDLVKIYKAKPGKIIVIPHGYNDQVFNPKADLGTAPMDVPYIFYIGRIEEKKNISLLIQTFALLSKEAKPIHLVLSGKNGYGFEAIQRQIEQLPASVQSRIHQPGYLPFYDMARYLSHAKAFVFPSLYEGFGMPILDAMAVGTPVVCSNTPALAEVCGNAAVLLPPRDPLQWASAISRIIHQPKVADELGHKGLKQVRHFSWDKAAEQTLEVIIDVARKSAR